MDEKEGKKAYVQCQIANTGGMDGKETIQVYLGPKERTEDAPVRQLKGFEKVFLKSGEKKKVRIEIEDYSDDMNVWAGSSLNELKIVRKEERMRK